LLGCAVHPDFLVRISTNNEVAAIQNINPREASDGRVRCKTAFVTGGARGIGLALGRAFAEAAKWWDRDRYHDPVY
jgi:hypothetical protein